jgi:hypothetical protein
MTHSEDEAIIARAQDYASAAPFAEFFQNLADEVDGWWADGVQEREIDERIRAWARDQEFDAESFVQNAPVLAHLTPEQRTAIGKALRFDEWSVACAKSIARTGKPIPFIYAIGDVFTDEKSLEDDGEVLVWAVATRATDPEVVARKFVKVCKQTFGDQVSKEQRPRVRHPGQMTPAQALAAHRQRDPMSYRDIAIQNLRRTYPNIIANPHRYKQQIATERSRVVDEIRAAEELWDKRLPDSPTVD